jgi:hypothetical protein
VPRRRTPMTHACELVTDPNARKDADRLAASIREAFPAGISRPASRALASAGFMDLHALSLWSEPELASLHGMGPKAIGLLREALHATGRDFRP